MVTSPWHYFTDPVLQAPTIASMLMCLASALIGVIVFLRRRSLLGEALSHASYPGVVLSILITALFFPRAHDALSPIVLIGGFCSCLLGYLLIEKMERSWKVKNDAALCFVLSIFFGVGVLVASKLQFSHALWSQTAHLFLYGQAATMTNVHIYLYASLCVLIAAALVFLFHSLRIAIFDRDYGKTVGVPIKAVDAIVSFLLILAIVIGIRSVGVVLMAGMLIAPAIAARQFSNRLKTLFFLAGLIGAFSGFFGNYLSVEIPEWGKRQGWDWKFSLPTGPMILLTASGICMLSLLLAPKSGFVRRRIRAGYFQRECQRENALKYLWKQDISLSFTELKKGMGVSSWQLFWMLFFLKNEGWIEEKNRRFSLTGDGMQRASQIVRLHRLWEVYLVHLGQGVEKVHRSAEEMEHILTPELEQELTMLLNDPVLDPHEQPIPTKRLEGFS
jgi:manganese/zinc/iron transport system permease protein